MIIGQFSITNTQNQPDGSVIGDVYIYLTDSVTGQPAAGNNLTVTYLQNIDDVQSEQTITVPGTAVMVWSGALVVSNSGFISKWTVESVSDPDSAPPPPPSVCDLTINSIAINQPESSIGAGDGKITVLATSTYGPIQYSLNNVDIQDSNVFAGLPGGAGRVYVTDSNGCTYSLPYTIPTATDLLVSDPSIDLGNGNVSRWNAAFNPIYFIYQRKDFEITGITNAPDGSGNILVAITGDVSTVKPGIDTIANGVVTSHSTGDIVYIQTANYEGAFEVLKVNGNSLVLACPYIVNDGVGFININSLRPYYQIQTQFKYVDPITGKFKTITGTNQPLTNGYCQCDFRSFLQSLLQANDLSDYSLLNYRDMQLSASYQVQYAEVWEGNTPIWITLPLPYYVLFAAMQLGDKGAGNMVEYIPYPLGFQPAKWLTDFINPVYNNGFPFDLAFIFSEYMVGLAPFYHITLLDINQNPLADQSVNDAFLLTEAGGFLLNQDGSKFIIARQALVSTPIVEHVGLNRLLLNFIPSAQCWYFKLELQYTAGGNTYPLMKPVICRIDQNTPDRSVYLRWIGLTGSWNYYRFVYNQPVSLTVDTPVVMKRFVINWQNEDTIEDVISKNATKQITVNAENISVDDINGCRGIKTSTKVQMLVSSNPVKWLTIIVQPDTYDEYDTMLKQGSFNVIFNLPSMNLQTQ